MLFGMMNGALALVIVVAFTSVVKCEDLRFDDDFLFGTATASYQVEGYWNVQGKGESIWDHMLHEHPEYTEDEQNGDTSAASYMLYRQDVKMVKAMNMDFYRFSISWPRILPNGDMSVINQAGIDYYSNLIDELLQNDIEPLVTMYHWDLPYELQKLGGWANRNIAQYFADYADLLFKTYGDRVKKWITINEPQSVCRGYAGDNNVAPNINKPGVADYLCGHTLLLAHAYTYDNYKKNYYATQSGQVGITLDAQWSTPKTDSTADKAAAEREKQFWVGWFANPIFSTSGDYPTVMRERIDANSQREGLVRSRLPKFTTAEINLLKGSADFFGLNHYTTNYAENGEGDRVPSREYDSEVITSQNDSWTGSGSDWLKVTPSGFREILQWIDQTYNKPKIFVTENGFSDKTGTLEDDDRINYFKQYLTALHQAINSDGVNVIGYTSWSLMDNFEWNTGYTEKFGVYHVNFESPLRTRTPKKSAEFLGKLASTHVLSSASYTPVSFFLSLLLSTLVIFRLIL